jgi:hypothetical protein
VISGVVPDWNLQFTAAAAERVTARTLILRPATAAIRVLAPLEAGETVVVRISLKVLLESAKADIGFPLVD